MRLIFKIKLFSHNLARVTLDGGKQVNKSLFNIRSVISLSLAHIIYLFCGDGKTAMCHAICNARSRYVHGIGKSSFLVLLWNINLYTISPRAVRADKQSLKSGTCDLYQRYRLHGIPTSGINYLGNSINSKKRNERNQITIIIHFSSIIIFYSVNLERRAVFLLEPYSAAFLQFLDSFVISPRTL